MVIAPKCSIGLPVFQFETDLIDPSRAMVAGESFLLLGFGETKQLQEGPRDLREGVDDKSTAPQKTRNGVQHEPPVSCVARLKGKGVAVEGIFTLLVGKTNWTVGIIGQPSRAVHSRGSGWCVR